MTIRDRQREEKRESIVDAAAALFAARGYAGTSVGGIASGIGVGKGAITFHFASKHQIVDELIAYYRAARQARASVIQEAGLRGLEAVYEVLRITTLENVQDLRVRAALRLMRDGSDLLNDAPNPFTESVSVLRAHLIEAAEDGELVPDTDVHAAAMFIVGVWLGVQELSFQASSWGDLEERMEYACGQILRGYKRQRPAQ